MKIDYSFLQLILFISTLSSSTAKAQRQEREVAQDERSLRYARGRRLQDALDNLRMEEGDDQPRKNVDLIAKLETGVVADIFNALVDLVLPTFNAAVRNTLRSRYEPYDLALSFSEKVWGMNLIFCKPQVGLDFDFGLMSGLSNISVNRFAMDDGSEYLNGDIFGDATFGALFDFVGIFNDTEGLVTDIDGDLRIDVCGNLGVGQRLNGTMGVKGTSVNMKAILSGGLNMLNLQGTLDKFNIDDFSVQHDEVIVDFDHGFYLKEPVSRSVNDRAQEVPVQLADPLQQVSQEVATSMLPFGLNIFP